MTERFRTENFFFPESSSLEDPDQPDERMLLSTEATSMKLLSRSGSGMSWPSTKTNERLPQLGRSLQRILRKNFGNDLILDPNMIPPGHPGSEPRFRIWLPFREAAQLPWEAAQDLTGVWLFCDRRFSIVYGPNWGLPPSSREMVISTPRILVATAMPQGMPSANIELQRMVIDRALRSDRHGRIEVEFVSDTQLHSLRNRIVRGQFTMLHVLAHGLPGRVMWYDEYLNPRWYSPREFAAELSCPQLDTVLWIVCHSGSPDERGQSLIRAGVERMAKSSIAMRTVIDDSCAAAFVGAFYQALGDGGALTLDYAVTEGRAAILRESVSGRAGRPGQQTMPMLAYRHEPLSFVRAGVRVAELTGSTGATTLAESQIGILTPDGVRWFQWGRRIKIGRSLACDIVLPNWPAAPFQAMICSDGEGWYIVDERSGTPTLVNDVAIEQQRLNDGDFVTVAELTLSITVKRQESGD